MSENIPGKLLWKVPKSVAVHGHSLRVTAEFSVGRWTDGPVSGIVTSGSAALLQSQQLLGTERLIVDLAGGFDKILEMGTGEEVSKVNKFAVVLILDIDHTPAILTAPNLLSVHDNVLLATNNCKGNDVLSNC